jgi:ankyrin repeat protein
MAGLTAQAETLDLLLDLGANISARGDADGFRGFTILHCVAVEGAYYMAKILINNRVDVNAMDEYNARPLARLADKNYSWAKPYRKRDSWDEALVELLMNNGADVNATDIRGLTALHRAAIQGNATMIKTLIKGGADVTKSNDGETPFDWAKNHPEVRGLLKLPTSDR